jgi:hypothetical protein
VLNDAFFSFPYDVLNDFAPISPLVTVLGVLYARKTLPVTVVIAVGESPLLLAVQRIVIRIEIKDDLLWRPRVRLHEQVDQKPLDGHGVVTDLVIARRLQSAQLQPV